MVKKGLAQNEKYADTLTERGPSRYTKKPLPFQDGIKKPKKWTWSIKVYQQSRQNKVEKPQMLWPM